ncbi:MAG: hypothetical protein OSP8Acid_03130 [uncultured Acidilobus sp. OSP8]|nr:MAG: hypothetical protein OSP8Acid_03130 [uncultured Acidilobus sp. OSP8]
MYTLPVAPPERGRGEALSLGRGSNPSPSRGEKS